MKRRVPITAITVFGTSSLLALSVGIVIFLGFGQAADSTRLLWASQSETLIDAMQQGVNAQLEPIRDQALWVAQDIHDLSDPALLDDFFYGVLAATPQVAGIAVIDVDGNSRRWHRDMRVAIEENWADKPWFEEYLRSVEATDEPAWREPIFTDTVSASTLLHDVSLRDADGKFIGIFAQIVKVSEMSAFLSRSYSDTGITPFVLYNHDYVLAHPMIHDGDEAQPLPQLEQFGDLVLARIWSPDETSPFIASKLKKTEASGIFRGDDYILFLYRNIDRYGPAPWTIGAYLNMSLVPNSEREAVRRSLLAGLAVLILGVFASVVAGRKVSQPVKALVSAAEAVNSGELNRVEALQGNWIRELDEASAAFNLMVGGLRERKLIRDTLGRFVPEKIASSLLAGGGNLEVQQTEATVLFCDIEAFTGLTEALGPVKIVDVLNAYFSRMVEILERYGGVVTQFQGDAILATFNVPVSDEQHARNAVFAARDMLISVAGNDFAGERLNIRIGINTGSVVAGAIGARGRLNYTVHGDAVNLAARLEAMNKKYGTRVLLSESTAKLLQDVELRPLGKSTARGQSRSTRLYTLDDDRHSR